MKANPSICLIGDIMVDVTLKNHSSDTKLRLGGIVHAARTLWALDIPYDVAYFAPSYLDNQIQDYLNHHGCVSAIKLGNVNGSPYVFLIQEAKEIGSQGYEFLLRDELKVEYNEQKIEEMSKIKYKDHLFISGNYDFISLINRLEGNVHIDVANNIKDLSILQSLTRKSQTIFVSTSSDIFINYYKGVFVDFVKLFENYTEEVVLKENRGGSRGHNFSSKSTFHASAQPRTIAHSVGVGDAFDAAYIVSNFPEENLFKRITFASWVAAEYAVTSFPDDFKKGIARLLKSDINELVKMPGISLPWETRATINIYIAAPDFTFVDASPIDTLDAALRYHNFNPRRPIKENGQMEEGATKARKQELMARDMQTLSECSLLIAVLLYNDPGTLIELGYASASGMPTIVYDPYKIATNCMLTELPGLVSDDLDEIIAEVFLKSSSLIDHGK